MLAGFAGSLYAHLTSYISPDTFGFDVTAQILSMVLIGGIGTTWGPVLGAVLLTFLPELLRVSKAYYLLIYGAGIAALIIFLPTGLLGLLRRRRPAPAASTADDVAAAPDTAVTSAPSGTDLPITAAPGADTILEASGLTCRFGGLRRHRRARPEGRARRDPCADRTERLGQVHLRQPGERHLRRRGRLDPLRGQPDRRPAALGHRRPRPRPHLPEPAPVPLAQRARQRAGRLPRRHRGRVDRRHSRHVTARREEAELRGRAELALRFVRLSALSRPAGRQPAARAAAAGRDGPRLCDAAPSSSCWTSRRRA